MNAFFTSDTGHDLSSVLNTMGDAICVADKDMKILAVNQTFAQLYGLQKEHLIGKYALDIYPEFKTSVFYKTMADTITTGEPRVSIGYSNNTKKHLMIRTFVYEENYILNIQEMKTTINKSGYSNTIDDLTSLANRTAFEDDLHNFFDYKADFALVMLDLNKFRLLNDSLGYDAGNLCLMEVAARLKLNCPHKIYRIGPNQFATLMTTTKDKALSELQTMLNSFKKPFNIQKEEFYITASAGFNFVSNFSVSISDAVANTEFALNKAKKIKNGYVEYDLSLNRNSSAMILAKDLKNAINTDQLHAYYQPQVDALNAKICGAEALIRWQHPTKGLVSPGEFLPIAIEYEMMQEIDRYMFIQVLKDMMGFMHNDNLRIPISINFSAATICNTDTIAFVDRCLKKTKVPPHLVVIEITETSLMDDLSKSQQVVQALSKMGIKIAIDDFGTGYSSMGYLVRYPTNFLKIDREFIKDIDKSETLETMTSNIIKLGKSLGITIVAEGVERREEYLVLKDNNCDIIQGYLFSKPVSKDIFVKFVRKVGFSDLKSSIM